MVWSQRCLDVSSLLYSTNCMTWHRMVTPTCGLEVQPRPRASSQQQDFYRSESHGELNIRKGSSETRASSTITQPTSTRHQPEAAPSCPTVAARPRTLFPVKEDVAHRNQGRPKGRGRKSSLDTLHPCHHHGVRAAED